MYIFLLLCGRKASQRLHTHLRRISAIVVFPVIAVPPNLSFMCHHQTITEVCALLGSKNVGKTKNPTKELVVCLRTLSFEKLSIIISAAGS